MLSEQSDPFLARRAAFELVRAVFAIPPNGYNTIVHSPGSIPVFHRTGPGMWVVPLAALSGRFRSPFSLLFVCLFAKHKDALVDVSEFVYHQTHRCFLGTVCYDVLSAESF